MKILRFLAISAAAAPLLIGAYAAWWGVQYRLPPSASETMDLRKDVQERGYYITFCASLASNPHGFPGHSYVVWSEHPCWNRQNAEAFGFVPRNSKDQLLSVFRHVPGLLVHGASKDNMANLDTLTVIVNHEKYQRTRLLRSQWDATNFKAGTLDCVAFMDYIAVDTGLTAPARKFSYPQDHLREMKALNATRLIRARDEKNWLVSFARKEYLVRTDQLFVARPIHFE